VKLLVVGLDGFEPSLVRRFAEDLPTITALMRKGRWGRLQSTLPYATFPAWSTFLTGVNPGEHGIFDFSRLRRGTYQLEFVGGAIRRRPTVARLASDAGMRVASLGFPGTYPPEPLNGVVIGGFDSPVAVSADASFVHPAPLAQSLNRRFGGWRFADFSETRTWVPGWHKRAARRLLDGVKRRTEIATWLMSREDFDLFMIHFGASDTVSHHFWAFHDETSPRRPVDYDRALDDVVRQVYVSLDTAVAELLDASGAEHVILASDHGFGGSGDKVLHLNRFLASRGWLDFVPSAGRPSAMGLATGVGLSVIPGRWQERIWRRAHRHAERAEASRRFRGIDFSTTRAYSEELAYHPCIRLNVAGRDPEGVVDPSLIDGLTTEIITAIERDLRDPWTGRPAVTKVWRRGDLYSGGAVDDAPELMLDMAFDSGYSYNCLPSDGPGPAWRRLGTGELLGRKGAGMNGTHRRDGFWLAVGPGVASRRKRVRMIDMAPSVMSALGLAQPEWFEGASQISATSVTQCAAECDKPHGVDAWQGYDERQRAVIEERLRKLGYI